MSVGLPGTLAPAQPERKADQARQTDHQQRPHRLATLLPHEDAQDDAAHTDDGEDGSHGVDLAGTGVGHVPYQLDTGKHDRDDHRFEGEADPPGQECGDEAAEQGPTAAAMAAAAPTRA